MPAASAIVISDGAATPVAHTFTPIGKDAKGVLWYEQTTPTPATPLEAKRIGYRQTRSLDGQAGGVSKAVISIAVPRPEISSNTSGGYVAPPSLAYKVVARIEVDLPERSTLQERKDLRSFASNLLATAFAVATFDSLQPTY
jgi:hypothetical protein